MWLNHLRNWPKTGVVATLDRPGSLPRISQLVFDWVCQPSISGKALKAGIICQMRIEITMQKLLLITLLLPLLGLFSVQAQDAEEEAPKTNSAYISLGKAMVLNLSSQKKKITFLQINADALINDDANLELVEAHIPAMRHTLIVLLSEQSDVDMKSSMKREELRQQATTEIQALITELTGRENLVSDLLFSSILVQ